MHDFTDKWDEISERGHAAGRFRVAPDHLLNLYLGYSLHGQREFSLETDADALVECDLHEFENIYIHKSEASGTYGLTLTLTDESLKDLFSVISYDLVEASSHANTVEGAAQIFVSRLNRWSELLKERRSRGMSLQESLGLVGELLMLDWLIKDAGIEKGVAVRAWRGPDGDSKDIGLNSTRIEIKAQLSTRPAVLKISSLDQLDGDGRGLCVALHRLTPAEEGLSLEHLADDIESLLAKSHDASKEYLRKLYLTGYDPAAKYAGEMYKLDVRRIFLVSEDFPKLVPGNVPEGIVKAAYDIDCSAVEKFEISLEDLERLVHG